jgi:N-acetylglucosamine-6-sulfatase
MKTLATLASAALCAALLLVPRIAGSASAYPSVRDPRPNVVVFMTNDQTARAMRAMPRTRALIGRAGTTFANSFASNLRCCPPRATFLTGQYSHNHGVLTNGPPLGGWERLRGTSNWLPTWLRRTGYRTAHVGKFLNGYGRDDPAELPPGWDEWHATVDPTTYRCYAYRVNENGTVRTYGRGRDPEWYSTDFIARRSAELAGRLAGSTQPFSCRWRSWRRTPGVRANRAIPSASARLSWPRGTARCSPRRACPGRRASTRPTCPTSPSSLGGRGCGC